MIIRFYERANKMPPELSETETSSTATIYN